jgi:hypothetical protein
MVYDVVCAKNALVEQAETAPLRSHRGRRPGCCPEGREAPPACHSAPPHQLLKHTSSTHRNGRAWTAAGRPGGGCRWCRPSARPSAAWPRRRRAGGGAPRASASAFLTPRQARAAPAAPRCVEGVGEERGVVVVYDDVLCVYDYCASTIMYCIVRLYWEVTGCVCEGVKVGVGVRRRSSTNTQPPTTLNNAPPPLPPPHQSPKRCTRRRGRPRWASWWRGSRRTAGASRPWSPPRPPPWMYVRTDVCVDVWGGEGAAASHPAQG